MWKKAIAILLGLLAFAVTAQGRDGDDDKKYLAGAVPMKNGIVIFDKTYKVSDKSKLEIYKDLRAYADSLLTPPMKGYAVTGGDGSFSLTVDGTAWLQVKSLGYADCVKRVAPGESGVDVKLEADGKTLAELVVKGSYAGVKVSGDTVRFDTDHFKTGAEDNIADVLRRLPGVDVSDDGHITYEGRGVSTLLVDGRDVFARGSEGTAVNNMSADIMTGAEILKNYAGYAVGNRYARGTGTALNIKTSGKHRLTGNADANGGLKDKYRGKGAAIYLGRSSSATALASANNTGEPVFTVMVPRTVTSTRSAATTR